MNSSSQPIPSYFRTARTWLICLLSFVTAATGLRAADASAFTCAITTPIANSAATTGVPVTITATVSGNANPIAKVTFYEMISGAVLGTAASAPYTISWTPTTAGTALLRVTGTDTLGGTGNSPITTVKVAAGSTSSGGGTSTPPVYTQQPSTYTLTVVNGTIGSGNATTANIAPYTTVTINANPAPAGQWFKQWNGNAPFANYQATTTTFTMPTANVVATVSYYTPVPVPQPVTGHPRLWINQSDVAGLRARANAATNPVYLSLRTVLNTCISNYTTKFYPNGQPNPTNPDFGDTQGYTGLLTEQNAIVFALFSLIDQDPNARILHAQRARNIIMMAMNEAVKPHASGQPFRDPMFALFNRANFTSECWPLAIDWIYDATDAGGNPILTAADKKTIRDVFMVWANDCLNAYVCGGDHPAPIGTFNSTALLPSGNAHRVAANNYYSGHARLVTLMSLCIDPVDDPAVNPAAPLSVLGNSMRSYIPDATGAWLYQQYAMFGDPADVKAAYNLTAGAKVGLASGGLSPEGGLYGHAFSYILGQMLALKTAGFADTAISGPQAALVTAPVWDRYLPAFSNNIVPAAKVYSSQSYLGPIFQMANYGDVLRLWITPDFMQVFALKNLLDQKTGNTASLDATRWFAINAVEGGAGALQNRISAPWSYGVQASVLYFLLLDPALPTPADPRPGYTTKFVDAGNGRVLSRTDWSANASVFTFRSSWESINHQDGDAGQFELYRKGEWLTKELSNYDSYGNGQSSIWHNTLALQNWCANGKPVNIQFFEAPYWGNGSQWNNGANAGDPVTVTSNGAGYTFVQSDITKLYNRPDQFTAANSAVDIQHASRSLLSLDPDVVVVYDRATSVHNGFKRFNLNFQIQPVINGHTATAITPAGQRIFVQSLLPVTGVLSYVPEGGTLSSIAQMEVMSGRLVVEDPAKPTDVRFLHVVQGADTANGMIAATTIASSAGTAFDGAVVGNTVALFPVNLAASFAGTSYSAPATTTRHYVTGLTPGAGYTVAASSDGVTAQLTVVSGGPLAADSAGVLAFDLASVLP